MEFRAHDPVQLNIPSLSDFAPLASQIDLSAFAYLHMLVIFS